MPVKNKIKDFVDNLGISVYEFRKRTSIAQRTAYDLYNEPWQLPSSTVLTKICDVFRVQPSELLEWVPPENRPAKTKQKSTQEGGKGGGKSLQQVLSPVEVVFEEGN